jgi:hypothetical protein
VRSRPGIAVRTGYEPLLMATRIVDVLPPSARQVNRSVSGRFVRIPLIAVTRGIRYRAYGHTIVDEFGKLGTRT